MALFALVSLSVSISIQVLQAASLLACPSTSQADFDFVVVGSGVGGGPLAARLAESGFSVLVVDAGNDVVNVNTTIPLYFGRAVEDPQLELNYTLEEFSPGAKFPRNDVSRARGLGGSTVHNAMINDVAATERDFDNLATMFNDSTWSYNNMRNYFKRIEDNLYLNNSDPDHGFNGWLKTNINPTSILANPQFADPQLIDIINTLATSGPSIDDINSETNDAAIGVGVPSYTIDEHRNRSSVRDHLVDTKTSTGGNLRFALDTLVTKVLLCENGTGGSPVAYGVEIAPGAALPVASNFRGKQPLQTQTITVRYEVIISAGVFQSPQLLSGIGDRDQLSQHGIEPIVHLPGVGSNLQDHDEVANIWTLKQNHTLFNGCTVLYTPEDDPCLEFWIESGHQNLYSFGAALFMMMSRSAPAQPSPDVMIYWAPAYFPGFVRGFPDSLANVHNALTAVILKAHPSSRGTVRLTGNHPQDALQIEKHHFEAPGGQQDIAAIRDGIKVARSIVELPNIAMHLEAQVFPDQAPQSDEEIDDHILEHVFAPPAQIQTPFWMEISGFEELTISALLTLARGQTFPGGLLRLSEAFLNSAISASGPIAGTYPKVKRKGCEAAEGKSTVKVNGSAVNRFRANCRIRRGCGNGRRLKSD
ncbi:hypothetical protein B0H19DRAFT_1233669 [Mycena capillaripes]|nr:hypothetical protein B0H19DRAFT_1233669 [Mycena capillaripes]